MQTPSFTRRTFLTGLAGCSALITHGMQPIDRRGDSRLRLSLAAYSFRDHLPNYRSNPEPGPARMDMLGFVDYAATLPLDAVELTSYFLPRDCPDALALQLKSRCHALGLDISGGAIGNNFAWGPGDELDKEMAYTEQWVKTYALMGVPVIRVFAGYPKTKGLDPAEAVANIKRNLAAAVEMAGKYGVILAVENHDFTTDIDRYMDVLAAVDSPWFGANLDSGNLSKVEDPYAQLARIAPYALNVQIKVSIPRNGVKEPADFKRLIQILKDAKYSGYVVLEYEEKTDPFTEVPKYLQVLRDLL